MATLLRKRTPSPLLPVMVDVPGGLFRMGSDSGRADETPVREVSVGPFALARTAITRAQYAPFVATAGVAAPPWWDDPDFADPNQPVVGITWFEAGRYAASLAADVGGSWRLPTEAEWERAARGGLDQAPTPWGDSVPAGEIPDGPLSGPWRVGRGTPNGFGLCDIGTIVHEWSADWYSLATVAADGRPALPARRASRGGSWRHRVRWSPPSARSSLPPDFRYADYGFRVLREGA